VTSRISFLIPRTHALNDEIVRYSWTLIRKLVCVVPWQGQFFAVLFANIIARMYAGASSLPPWEGPPPRGAAYSPPSLLLKFCFFSRILVLIKRFFLFFEVTHGKSSCSFCKVDVRWKHLWAIVCRPTGCEKTIFIEFHRVFSDICLSCPTWILRILFYYVEWQGAR